MSSLTRYGVPRVRSLSQVRHPFATGPLAAPLTWTTFITDTFPEADSTSLHNKATTTGGGTWKIGPSYSQDGNTATWGGFIVSTGRLVNNLDQFNNYFSLNHPTLATAGRRISVDYVVAGNSNCQLTFTMGSGGTAPAVGIGFGNGGEILVAGSSVLTGVGTSGTFSVELLASGALTVKINGVVVYTTTVAAPTFSATQTDFTWKVPSTGSWDNFTLESQEAAVTLTPVTSSRSTTWNVASAVTSTRATTWNVRAAVTSSRSTTWHVYTTTTSSRATTWNVRAAITSTRATTWNVRAAVTSSRVTTWHTLAVATSTRASTWNVLAAVSSSRATTWNVRAAVTSSRATTWNVASTTVSVTSSRATTWNVAAAVSSTRATTWHVRAGVTSTRSTTWNVLTATTSSRATTWTTRAAIASQRATTWHVRAFVTSARATTWNVNAAAVGPFTITGNVGTLVGADFPTPTARNVVVRLDLTGGARDPSLPTTTVAANGTFTLVGIPSSASGTRYRLSVLWRTGDPGVPVQAITLDPLAVLDDADLLDLV